MTDATPLPPAMARRARDFHGTPAPARAAATVVLLRPAATTAVDPRPDNQPDPGDPRPDNQPDPGDARPRAAGHGGGGKTSQDPFDVYVLRRANTMVFGGVYAFPGGGVDPTDRPQTIRTDWADRLGVPDDQARAVVGAAARELFEETGVLLAGPIEEPARTVGDVSDPRWEADRRAVAAREITLSALLDARGLRLRDDLLFPWARWITPEFEPKRFDTWFFVALLPAGQTARDVSGEAAAADWISPAAADGLAMLPPTRTMLNDLRAYASVEGVVTGSAHRDAGRPIMPRVELNSDGEAVLRLE